MAKSGTLKGKKVAATIKGKPQKTKEIAKSTKSVKKSTTAACKNSTKTDQHSTFQIDDAFLCPICLNTYPRVKATKSLKCGHCFHQICVSKWFLMSRRRKCPVCRQTA
ncbi:hypothetical protein JTE90_021449 [Oedothorax gibbosus]|uniref:RING-type domain-containing protein n=1 Tax=Oedothorax gibbosus TaxID=931172 RepID=A0AAV6VWC5_9ARAC|nr:hypothetical protein JTE90_021449 [Oedothorax gibbosus]